MFQDKTWIKMPKRTIISLDTPVFYVFITEIILETFDVIIDNQ